MKRLLALATAFGLASSFAVPLAFAATPSVSLSLAPSSQTVKVGSEFVVELFAANTNGAVFNAVDANLSYTPATLTLVSLSKTQSIVQLWSSEPTFSQSLGTITLAGGRTSGAKVGGLIITMKFKSTAPGDAWINLVSGGVYANDGKATNLLGAFVPGHYAIADALGNVSLSAGDLIKLPDDHNASTNVDSAVYYFGADGLRYVFPNYKTYNSWYADFNNVKEVAISQMGSIGIGGNVTYRPGVRMLKIDSDPKVYVIDRGGVRHAIPSEAVATGLYGATWNKMIDDVPDSFFGNYTEGMPLSADTTWKAADTTSSTTSISADKVQIAPVEVTINADGTFSPSSVTVARARTVRFTNKTGATFRLGSDPHPSHTGLPGFDSAYIPIGLNYVFRFNTVGTFGYHNHAAPASVGSVTVTP